MHQLIHGHMIVGILAFMAFMAFAALAKDSSKNLAQPIAQFFYDDRGGGRITSVFCAIKFSHKFRSLGKFLKIIYHVFKFFQVFHDVAST